MLRLYVALSDKENHHILQHYCTNLIEVLQSVMNGRLVRLYRVQIEEVKALNHHEDLDEKVCSCVQKKQHANEEETACAEHLCVHDSENALQLNTLVC